MLTLLAVALLLGAGVVGVRWFLQRRDVLGRRRSFPWVAVVGLLVLALLAALPGIRRAQQEEALAQVTSALAGKSTSVHCQTFGETFVDAGAELGYVRYDAAGRPEPSTLIKRDQCAALADYRGSDKSRPSRAEVVAVHVLTHEAMHMAGITSEAPAECAAMQRDAEAARLLGASPEEARALARYYWRAVYPHMPEAYRSRECRPGGQLDESLPDPPWSEAAGGNASLTRS